MIGMSDKKKAASLIVAMHLSKKHEPEHEDEHEGKDGHERLGGHHYAAQEILDAVSDRNVIALTEALKSFWDLCEAEEDEEEVGEHEGKAGAEEREAQSDL